MTHEELDRALEEALQVPPPAGYAARTRARMVAEQAASTSGHTWWSLGAVAAAVMVLVAGGLFLERDDSPAPIATVASRAGDVARDTSTRLTPQATGDRRRATGDGRQAAGDRRLTTGDGRQAAGDAPRNADALPAVLISPDDAAGLRLLVTLAEAGLAVAVTDGSDGEGPLQVGRIDVPPLEVAPLPQLTPVVIGELQ